MSYGENWGNPKVEAGKGFALHSQRGENKNAPFLEVPSSSVKHVTGTKTDVTLALKAPEATSGAYTSELRFSVPKACTAFGDEEEDPAKSMLIQVRNAVGGAAAVAPAAASAPQLDSANVKQEGTLVAKIEGIPFASPAGLFNISITDAVVTFTEPKKNLQFTVAHAQVDKLFTFDSVLGDSKKYFAIGLRAPIKIGATTYTLVTASVDNDASYTDADPWTAEISDEEITKRYPQGSLFKDREAGLVSDVLCKVFKTAINCKLLSGAKDFRSVADKEIAGVRTGYRSNIGGLFILKDYFLFLHKPATLVPWTDVNTVAVDSNRDSTTFSVTFNCKKSAYSTIKANEEKYPFVGIARNELHPLRKYLAEEKKLIVSCPEFDEMMDMSDDEDEESDDEDEEEDESDESDDGDDSDIDSDDSEKPKKKKKKAEKKKKEKSKKEKKKKSKEDKKHKDKKEKSKKEKKEKHKKEKKDKKDKSGDVAVDRQKRERDE